MKRRIAVLGGMFDPPHFGHLLVAQQVLEFFHLDEILFVPAFKRNLTNKAPTASFADRAAMTKLLIAGNQKFKLSEVDFKRGGITYSIETVLDLKKELPQALFYWIVGSDLVSELPRWKAWERLKKEVTILIFPRNGFSAASLSSNFKTLPKEELITTTISSSLVRERLKKGLSIVGLTSQRVIDYIKKHNLYL